AYLRPGLSSSFLDSFVHEVSTAVTRQPTFYDCAVQLCVGRSTGSEPWRAIGRRACRASGLSVVRLEREAQVTKERAALLVGLRRRDDRDVEAADAVDLVLIDLVEHGLLLETER